MSAWIVRGTIWLALVAFVAAEGGRWWAVRQARRVPQLAAPKLAQKTRASASAQVKPASYGGQEGWAPHVFLLGALVCAAHFAAAMHWHHAWSHARAVAFTAEQTNAVYGLRWGGGFWINYLFLAVWLADAMWWLAHPKEALAPASRVRWSLRVFYAIVIVNAAIVFTTGVARVAGAILGGTLLVFWSSFRRPSQ